MSITPVGYLFIASVVFGIGLMTAVNRRWAKNGKQIGAFANIYFGIILVTISTFFIMGITFMAKMTYDTFTYPKYEATIISFESRWQTVEREDTDGDTYTEEVLMYKSKLQFVDDAGLLITHEGTLRDQAEPVVGDTVKIAYKDGNLIVVHMAYIGVAVSGVFMMIFGYILAEVGSFVVGHRPRWIEALGGVTFTIVIYGGMIGLLVGLLYGGVYKYFLPGSDVPVWVMLMSVFFSLILALTLKATLPSLFQKKPRTDP